MTSRSVSAIAAGHCVLWEMFALLVSVTTAARGMALRRASPVSSSRGTSICAPGRFRRSGRVSRQDGRFAAAPSCGRHRVEFLEGRPAIEAFLTRKWNRELDYRLIKEVWAFCDNRIAVRFAYEWHDDGSQWFRSYGNENWEFDEHGLMRLRIASINDAPIKESERKYHWPLGRRPDDHPSLSELGL